jgi:tetratricopeptide (TPR) repeat protein
LKEANRAYPKFPLALNELGVQYLKLGQTEKAIDVLRTAVKLSPDAPGPKLNLGVALLERKEHAEAEQQLQRGAEAQFVHADRAHVSRSLPDTAQPPRRSGKRATVGNPGSGNQLGMAQYYLGGIYWKKQDFPRAVAALEDYLRLTPNALTLSGCVLQSRTFAVALLKTSNK